LKGGFAWQIRGGRQSKFVSEARKARKEISAQEVRRAAERRRNDCHK
jgi:hypothetical protein